MSLTPILTPSEFSASTDGVIAPNDPRLGLLLEGASRAIRRYCGWHVTPVIEETLTLDGPGGPLLRLPTLHVEEITSLKINGQDVDVDSLEWSQTGMVRRSAWPAKFRSIQIGIKHGFEDAADVKQIVQQIVGNAISSPLGATREQAGQVSISWSTTAPGVAGGISLLQRDLAVLDLYRLAQGL